MTDYWQKQDVNEPLFPDILWSRPETKTGSRKLAIVGGNSFAIGAPGIAYNHADLAGAGVIRILLPESVKHTVGQVIPQADFAPNNPSGSFSKKALAELIDISLWSDATLLSGDFGRNSETAVLLESFTEKYSGLLTVTQDAVDYFNQTAGQLLSRENTLVVLSLAQLQKLCINNGFMTPITYGMTLLQLVEALHELTTTKPTIIIVKHNDQVLLAYAGRIVSVKNTEKVWRIKTAAQATVFWMQNPLKPLESIATSLANYSFNDV